MSPWSGHFAQILTIGGSPVAMGGTSALAMRAGLLTVSAARRRLPRAKWNP